MRAAFLTGYGGNEVVSHGERPDPAVDDGEVLLEVHAAGVNPVEVTLRAGLFKLRKLHFPQIMGLDVSGVVLQAPSGSGHKPATPSMPVSPAWEPTLNASPCPSAYWLTSRRRSTTRKPRPFQPSH